MLSIEPASIPDLAHITGVIAAIGGLGAAAYGIVDVTKSFRGGVSNRGFACIAETMATLVPDKSIGAAAKSDTTEPALPPALSLSSMLVTLKSNWINGMPAADQRAIAKSLIKLRLNGSLAATLAQMTGVNPETLTRVAIKIAAGSSLAQDEADCYGRFDLILTTLLDQAYQRADQQYRNTAKLLAVVASVVLAVTGAGALGQIHHFFLEDPGFWRATIVGLLATPLAPVAKDLATAIQAGAKVAQAWRK